ncbi:COG1361 S-layer family protein [Candidatus Woesearchaeota archaeon]|nr:COG1361 S-layer family protein [Candidatus Woesearchaeota archaeon]
MNKKIILSLFVSLFVLAGLVFAAIPDAAQIKITLISQEPDPANPGDVIDLRFKVENTGSTPSGDLVFEILPEYPFSLYRGSSLQSIGSLQGRQTDEEGAILLYKIKVNENAVEREETIDIRYRAEDDAVDPAWVTVEDFPVRIRTRDIVVSIEEITTSPDPIPPGKESTVSLKIRNNADSLVRDVKIKLDMSDATVPFAPIRSTTERQIYQIDAKKEVGIGFNIIAEPDADGGIYKVPITISYTDETGTSYSKDDILTLKIASETNILATIDSTDIYKKNKAGEVTVKIVNRGLTEIKLLTAKLASNDDFEVLSQQEVYIGNVDSDDYETVDFTLDIKSKEPVVNLPVELIYMDSTNNEMKQTMNVGLRVFSESDAQKAGIAKEKGVGLTITFLIIVVGLGIYWWRKRKKKKSKKQ